MNADASSSRDYRTVITRCLRLRCPACGQGKFLKDWWRAHSSCSECGYDFEREPGFYLGSIYVNYGLTCGLVLAVCMPLLLTGTPYTRLLPPAIIFAVVFPIWFHRYARSVWLGLDYRWDPSGATKRSTAQSESVETDSSGAAPKRLADDELADDELAETCPFCHHAGRYQKKLLGRWVNCLNCGQQILLNDSSPPPTD